jgi:fatty acid desaturase
MFREPRWNRAYEMWLSVFYGCPVFVWIPTHHGNHHRYLNGEGDVTRTSRHARKNSGFSALSYPFHSTRVQWPLIRNYVTDARKRGGARLRRVLCESLAVAVGHAALLCLALLLHGFGTGTLVYAFAVGLPAALAPSWMMFTNYLQHVDCVADSAHDHSRNFENTWFNWFVFDNGYHTVHHEQPGLHWSHYRALHEARAARIDPRLNQDSLFAYCFSTYVWVPLRARLTLGGPRRAA